MSVILILAFLMVSLVVVIAIYDRYFHPLSCFPGPRLASMSPVWAMHAHYSGRILPEMRKLHEKYGPVIRISPNEISFSTIEARDMIYKDEYTKGFSLLKDKTRIAINILIGDVTAQTAPDKIQHQTVRSQVKNIASTFSPKQQEEIHAAYLERLIAEIDGSCDSGSSYHLTQGLDELIWRCVGHFFLGHPIPMCTKESYELFIRWDKPFAMCMHFLSYISGFPGASKLGIMLLRILPSLDIISWSEKNTFNQLLRLTEQSNFKDGPVAQRLRVSTETNDCLDAKRALAHISLLIIGGYDPTKTAASAIFYFLLRYPECLAKLQDELRTTFTNSKQIADENLSQLGYLNACISESLRLLPPVNNVSTRESNGVSIDGCYIPNGTKVSVDIYTLHRSSKYWDSPNDFCPERWYPECKANSSAYSPFSVGTHACPGKSMSLRLLRLTVAKLLYKYDLKLANPEFNWERDAQCSHIWVDFSVRVRATQARPM